MTTRSTDTAGHTGFVTKGSSNQRFSGRRPGTTRMWSPKPPHYGKASRRITRSSTATSALRSPATYTFLTINGVSLTADSDCAWDFLSARYASGDFQFDKLEAWLRTNTQSD